MDLKYLSDKDAFQLFYSLISAKFLSEKSKDVCSFSVVNSILKYLSEKPYSNLTIKRAIDGYFQTEAPDEVLEISVQYLRQHLSSSGGIGTDKQSVVTSLRDKCYPYQLSDMSIERALRELGVGP